jgi:hypothetical protein
MMIFLALMQAFFSTPERLSTSPGLHRAFVVVAMDCMTFDVGYAGKAEPVPLLCGSL